MQIVMNKTADCIFSWYSSERNDWLEFQPADQFGIYGVGWRNEGGVENAGTLAEMLEYFFWCMGVAEVNNNANH